MTHASTTLAVVLGCGLIGLASCGGSQPKAQAQLVAIVAGCKASLDIERDAGAAGAIEDTARGCDRALDQWGKP